MNNRCRRLSTSSSILVDDRTLVSSDDEFLSAGPRSDSLPTAPLKLPPDYTRLEIDFTALNFSSPENIRFRYRLEGFDLDWNDSTDLHRAVYPRLTAGNYRFRVIAANGDGVWNEQGAAMSIGVAPFFWQTWWFQLSSFAAFAATALVLVRYVSLRRLRRRLQMLEARSLGSRARPHRPRFAR